MQLSPENRQFPNLRTKQPVWTRPQKLREIPSVWWDDLLDGNLWVLDLATVIPFKIRDHETIRQALYRQSDRRNVKVSIRMGEAGTLMYVQAYPKEESGYEVRKPLEEALAAPRMPDIRRTPVNALGIAATAPPRFPQAQERMVAAQRAQGWANYPPAAMLRHPVIGYIAASCTCETATYRQHHDSCAAAGYMSILERQLNSKELAEQSPEQWAMLQEGVLGARYWEHPTSDDLL